MQDLCCAHCARVLIADFWAMVDAETVRTFSSFTLTCSCGHRVRVDLDERRKWVKLAEAGPLLAQVRAA